MRNKWVKFMLLLVVLVIIQPYNTQAAVSGASVEECLKSPDQCDEGSGTVEPSNQENREQDSITIGFLDMVKMIAALAFVIILLYFLLKWMNKKSQSYQQNRLIQHLGGTSLGGNRSIQMVKAGNQILILGVGEDVQLLKEIANPKEQQAILQQYNDQLENSIQPAYVVAKATELIKDLKKNKKDENADQSFHQHFKTEMDELIKRRKHVLKEFQEKEHDQP